MRHVILFATLLIVCWPSAASPRSNTLVKQPLTGLAIEGHSSDAFASVLRSRRAWRTLAAVSLTVKPTRIRPRLLNAASGRLPVLSLAVTVTNSSAREIGMNLAHEWSGGIWPTTDLYVAVRAAGNGGASWSNGPGYLVGEKASADNLVYIKAGATKTFDIRLNWTGTGSVPAMPLIDEAKPGRYSIKFLVFFTMNGYQNYLESSISEIEVEN